MSKFLNWADFKPAFRDGVIAGIICGVVCIVAAGNADAQTVEQIRRVNPVVLMEHFRILNEHCQGDPGVDVDTYPACLQRQLVEQQLNIAGYERDGQDNWHRVRVIITK